MRSPISTNILFVQRQCQNLDYLNRIYFTISDVSFSSDHQRTSTFNQWIISAYHPAEASVGPPHIGYPPIASLCEGRRPLYGASVAYRIFFIDRSLFVPVVYRATDSPISEVFVVLTLVLRFHSFPFQACTAKWKWHF